MNLISYDIILSKSLIAYEQSEKLSMWLDLQVTVVLLLLTIHLMTPHRLHVIKVSPQLPLFSVINKENVVIRINLLMHCSSQHVWSSLKAPDHLLPNTAAKEPRSRRTVERWTSNSNLTSLTQCLQNGRNLSQTSKLTKTPKCWWPSFWSTRAAVYLQRSSRWSTALNVLLNLMRNTWRRPYSVPISLIR